MGCSSLVLSPKDDAIMQRLDGFACDCNVASLSKNMCSLFGCTNTRGGRIMVLS